MIQDKRLPLKETVVEFLKKNPFYRHAGWAIGKDEDTLILWRKEDPDFSERCNQSRSECMSRLVNRSSPDFILTHADPKTFNIAKKVEVSGDPLVIIKNGNRTQSVANTSVGRQTPISDSSSGEKIG